jgi:signal transduction histidine kinase
MSDTLEQRKLQHKLLEPLTIILGEVSLLLDGLLGEISPKQKEHISKIKAAAEKLSNNTREHLLGSPSTRPA